MKTYLVVLSTCIILLVGCESKPKPKGQITETHAVKQKDTIDLDDFIYDIRDGAIKTTFVDYNNQKINHTGKMDTFYVLVEYQGKFPKIKQAYEIGIFDLSKNLKLLGKDDSGRFKFAVDRAKHMENCYYGTYITTENCLFKIQVEKNYRYKNSIELERKIINLW